MVDETLQICISPPDAAQREGAIVRFYWFPCIHMKDALRNKAYKQKGLADAVDAGKAFCFALGYAIWEKSLVIYVSSQFRR